jgi:hypothetical protein
MNANGREWMLFFNRENREKRKKGAVNGRMHTNME